MKTTKTTTARTGWTMKTTIKRSSWFRRRFERWLSNKFMVRYGPCMIQRRGYWQYIDHEGSLWRLIPTYSHGRDTPLVITLEER